MSDLKIYFAGSIRGGREDQALYLQIIDYLSQFGKVLTEHVGDAALSSFGEDGTTDDYIYQRDMDWLKSAQVIIAEVTTPSLGVGYELGMAEALQKKVLCLYRPKDGKRLSAMIGGNPYFTAKAYQTLAEAQAIIKAYLS